MEVSGRLTVLDRLYVAGCGTEAAKSPLTPHWYFNIADFYSGRN